ncbi:MAG TPA: (d)CMP kinase [Gemmatimonadaceae bacterium]|jgi:cytidylate kinase|nr:(d)CMP kinase [Gemmatimonadaceae bacterium]
MPNRKIAIAIDGPAASGKSSTAKAVARELHFRHVDSGALYRAATAATLRAESNSNNWTEDAVLDAAKTVSLSPTETGFTPLLDGADADSEMRGEPVTSRVSLVAQMPRVREWVNAQVRKANENFDVVVDGRDIGTVVFPDAALKVFLVADPAERARRRLIERLNRAPTDDEVAQETGKILLRDEMDAKQSGRAPDATLIDTTHMNQAEQIRQIVEMARKIRDAS